MSTEQHEAAAREHERIAREHEVEDDMAGIERHARCAPEGHRGAGAGGDICWTSTRYLAEDHQAEADRHRLEAEAHRAASTALREAEARACVHVALEDRDAGPFTHVDDILDVLALSGSGVAPSVAPGSATEQASDVVGAVVTFRPVAGLTRENLQAIVDCHLARNAARGHVVPEEPNCPLVPRGVQAKVRQTARGFDVEMRAADATTARDVLARARRLIERRPPR